MYPPVKTFIICVILVNLAATIYGTIQLKVDFDPSWYVHQHGTVLKIREYTEKYFPKTNEFKSKYFRGMRSDSRFNYDYFSLAIDIQYHTFVITNIFSELVCCQRY